MISVISPPFISSEICRREVEGFWNTAGESGGRWVQDKARLLKVLKTAVSAEEMPPQLADIFSPLLGFEFFEKDPETGRVREFDEAFGPALKQRFFERGLTIWPTTCPRCCACSSNSTHSRSHSRLAMAEMVSPGTESTSPRPPPTCETSATESGASCSSAATRCCPTDHCRCWRPTSRRRSRDVWRTARLPSNLLGPALRDHARRFRRIRASTAGATDLATSAEPASSCSA